ncbi:DUF1349 domain-containing protein [Agromyces aureus]|uniref:Uncharacterized protein n=1 Tax=Agromyces aureus TaxID=453304 RepID=A0A191WIW2_9MICO|nr:DUF1349 domain-containing protein [Agromyces aureus]ANJ28196.1 hypothetical protein ATC03_17285 [Agromyces aureus]
MSTKPRSTWSIPLGVAAVTAVLTASIVVPAASAEGGVPLTPATVGYGSSNPAEPDASAMAEHAAEREVVDVTDFGADPTGERDSAEAIADAVQHAKELGGPVTIRFPYGTYDIYPERTEKRELYVSNTTGADAGPRVKNIGILIEDMSDVIVDGEGSKFNFHGLQTQIAAIRTEDVTFTRFGTDWVAPNTVDLTVLGSGVANGVPYRDIQVPPGTRYEISNGRAAFLGEASPVTGQPYWRYEPGWATQGHNQRRHLATGQTYRTSAPVWTNSTGVSELGDNRLRVTYSGSTDPGGRGEVYELRPTYRDTPGIFAFESTNTDLIDLEFGYLHGFGMVAQMAHDITLDGVRFKTDAGTWRQTSGFADYLQMSGVGGKVQILNSLFDNPHDDPINIHGTYMQVKGVDLANKKVTLQYMHNQSAGFPQFYPGDTLRFIDRGTMLPVADAEYTVAAVSGPSGYDHDTSLTQMTVTLDRAPTGIQVDTHAAESLTYTPEVRIAGNTFTSIPTRGILVTTPKPVVIERNMFDQAGMASIYVSGDAAAWYESGGVEDLVIRENIFDRPTTNAPVIYFDPTNSATEPERTVHKNVLIDDNRFNLLPGTQLINAKSVSDLTFTNNAVGWYGPTTSPDPSKSSRTALFQMNGSHRFEFSDNTYATGFNVRVSTNTAASEVTGNDPFKVNADSMTQVPTVPLASGLTWIREDASRWSAVAPDSIRLLSGGGTLWATQNSSNGILLRDAGGATPNEVVVKMSGATKSFYEEAGLIYYVDDENYVALHRKHNNGSPGLALVTEAGGSPNENTRITAPTTADIWLKITRNGNAFTGSYSTNGVDFTTVGTITNSAVGAATPRVGVMADGPFASGSTAAAFVMSGLKVDGQAVPFFDSVPAPVEVELAAALEDPAWQGVDFGAPVAPRSWLAVVPADVDHVSTTLTPVDDDTDVVLTLDDHPIDFGTGAVELPLAAGPNVLQARSIAPNGDSQTYRWTIVSLKPGVVVGTRPPVEPKLDVEVTAGTRCVARKTAVAVRVRNDDGVPIAAAITSDYGSKTIAAIAPGTNGTQTFSTRAADVAAGTVSVTVTAVIDGIPVTQTTDASYTASDCA